MIKFLRYSGDISVGECVKNEHVGGILLEGNHNERDNKNNEV